MARGDTQPPRRAHFAEDSPLDDIRSSGPRSKSYPCRAHGCPMPGTVDETCGWHYRESPQDWGRITAAVLNWETVSAAINRARTVLCAPATCCDGKAQREAMDEAFASMGESFTSIGWKRRVEPQPGENLGDWCVRLERFLAARIKSDLSGGREIDETQPTPTVAQMRKELRAEPLKGNAGDWL